ncbi:MAG: hydantoinase/oxoprolinase family protein [Geminicoccaceae bacterium]
MSAKAGIDIGGTFTDVVIETGVGRTTHKELTTPQAPEEGVLAGLETCLQKAGLEVGDLSIIVHGTTLATNAVIERKGAKTALIATQGFRDTLEIADEGRFDQYDLNLVKPKPLVPRELRFTVPERVAVTGDVLLALDESAVHGLVRRLRAAGIESVAVAFIHAYAAPDHERRVAAILGDTWPDLPVSLSSEVCPEIREHERTSTTCANAYVQPLIAGYLARLEQRLHDRDVNAPIYLMSSGGGLTTIAMARKFPVRLIESGPAGGAILAGHLARCLDEPRVLSFDMGGTTAKICLIDDGEPQTARRFEFDRTARFMKGSGLPLRIPVIDMVEIGAGGGSIAQVDPLQRIQVGPESAGAEPGPACYGRGGEASTVTDADLVLGKLDPETFAGGRIRLDAERAGRALHHKIGEILGLATAEAALGVAEMVDETMASAARVHGVENGKTVADYAMIAFGGAAPLHAARVAEKLGIDRVIVPTDAGVGSAVGFLLAPASFEVLRSAYGRLDRLDIAGINALLDQMAAEAWHAIRDAVGDQPVRVTRIAAMRCVGQGHEVDVALPEGSLTTEHQSLLRTRFEDVYLDLFGRIIANGEIEILTYAVTLSSAPAAAPPTAVPEARNAAAATSERRLIDPASRKAMDVPVFDRQDLRPGDSVRGPCLIADETTTIVVTPAFDGVVDLAGNLILSRKAETDGR